MGVCLSKDELPQEAGIAEDEEEAKEKKHEVEGGGGGMDAVQPPRIHAYWSPWHRMIGNRKRNKECASGSTRTVMAGGGGEGVSRLERPDRNSARDEKQSPPPPP